MLSSSFSKHHLLCPASRVDASEDGDHRLCFDNSHSKLSQKMIFFEVTVDGPNVAAEGGRKAWLDVAFTNQDEIERPVAAIRVRRRSVEGAWSATGVRL